MLRELKPNCRFPLNHNSKVLKKKRSIKAIKILISVILKIRLISEKEKEWVFLKVVINQDPCWYANGFL